MCIWDGINNALSLVVRDITLSVNIQYQKNVKKYLCDQLD